MKQNQPDRKYVAGDAYPTSNTHSDELGPLSLLPGKWEGVGTGWNIIALPFSEGDFKYRVLMNQYDEQLEFSSVDENVPNRGLAGIIDDSNQNDQFVVTLDFQQTIQQTVADDFPVSGLAGGAGLPIHHEPGLWLYMKNLQTTDKDITGDAVLDIARLSTIPHGNSLLALGTQETICGAPEIPKITGLPIGRFEGLETDPYLAPYKHYVDNPFMGNVAGVPGFPGFHPINMNEILEFENQGVEIEKTTILTVDTTRQDAGIANIPFVVKQAEPVSMKSTFWIQELKAECDHDRPRLRMQYSQVVMLDFFLPRSDGLPGRAQWPHISINTLEKVM